MNPAGVAKLVSASDYSALVKMQQKVDIMTFPLVHRVDGVLGTKKATEVSEVHWSAASNARCRQQAPR